VGGGAFATPLAGMQIVRVENDAYREAGAGVADLSVGHQGFNAVESEVGGKLADGVATAWGRLDGDLQAGWVHSLTNGPIGLSAEMGGVGFVSTTARPAADGVRLTAGFSLERSDSLSIRLEYSDDLRANYQSHAAMLKIGTAF
jgi:uncharacterized protein with beta-barrel porin domain